MSTEQIHRDTRSSSSADTGAAAGRRSRPPRTLVFLLSATLVLGVVWALVVPPLQAPDEIAHVAYVQSLAENGDLPGDPDRPLLSTEQSRAQSAANTEQLAQQLLVKPEWSARRADRWLEESARLTAAARADGGGPNPASSNPPLSYLYLVPAYEASSHGDLFARLTVMRLASVLLLLVTVTGVWLLAGTVFGPRRPLQLAAAALPAFLPMTTFVSASIGPDSMLYALSALALWLGARVIVGRARTLDVVALCAVTALAVLTKATGYALVPPVAFAVVVGAWRAREGLRRVAVTALIAAAAFTIVVAPWLVVARANDRPATGQLQGARPASDVDVRELASYLWQYYLPRLPFQNEYVPLGDYPQAYETWFKRAVAAFGWLEIRWSPAVYAGLLAVWLALIGGAAVAIHRRRRRLDWMLMGFFAIALGSLLTGLHWSEYRIAESSHNLLSQGRYLFPLLGIASLVPAAALTALPARWRPPALGAYVGGLVVLELAALGLVATRFYV
jgi:4-amino-4-deoxy-L-arabinose transferase-like glycosyltransferase